jgi:hypothetical protein
MTTESLEQQGSQYAQFLNTPSIWTLNFMQKPVWGRLTNIYDDGTLEITISRGRVILAKSEAVVGVGMV